MKLLITDYCDAKTKAAALGAGARGFVSKERIHELRSIIAATS